MITTGQINYNDGSTVCRAFIAYNLHSSSPVPAVMVAHDWGGRGDDACKKAKELALLGYVGFAIDMYGNAKTATEKAEKRALMAPLVNDRQKLVNRIRAAFEALLQLPQVDKKKYCCNWLLFWWFMCIGFGSLRC